MALYFCDLISLDHVGRLFGNHHHRTIGVTHAATTDRVVDAVAVVALLSAAVQLVGALDDKVFVAATFMARLADRLQVALVPGSLPTTSKNGLHPPQNKR